MPRAVKQQFFVLTQALMSDLLAAHGGGLESPPYRDATRRTKRCAKKKSELALTGGKGVVHGDGQGNAVVRTTSSDPLSQCPGPGSSSATEAENAGGSNAYFW